ncbi:hypothetical protein APR04_004985 [Promicromonospora umidemergens]|uniref:EthD domain-containing protein n=1 Tax=Promicromonospora umidemergens TaxID=629679 RepID=A0ABP8XWV3_9MICO|nr:hypothetical protein [Promicromonospora umidemergens]
MASARAAIASPRRPRSRTRIASARADHDAFFASTNYRELVHPDEARFIDLASVEVLVTEETTVL